MATKIAHGLYAWTLTLEDGTVRQMLASSLAAVTDATPPPVLSSLVPATAAIGDPNFTLQVVGTGFQPSDVILWNGAPEPTTFVSATELTTGVNMATAQAAITLPVSVHTILGEISNVLDFTLTTTTETNDART
jgi:hypothetical protein